MCRELKGDAAGIEKHPDAATAGGSETYGAKALLDGPDMLRAS
ncbi:hypothetical protein [Halomonas salipaludis]|nr:hypothetical protein [Halomonas salipaludis]